jgi:hypothetical protein
MQIEELKTLNMKLMQKCEEFKAMYHKAKKLQQNEADRMGTF